MCLLLASRLLLLLRHRLARHVQQPGLTILTSKMSTAVRLSRQLLLLPREQLPPQPPAPQHLVLPLAPQQRSCQLQAALAALPQLLVLLQQQRQHLQLQQQHLRRRRHRLGLVRALLLLPVCSWLWLELLL
jgi:hypothetical protein